jgi:hypothetical protein
LRDAIREHKEALGTAIDAALTILGSRSNDGFRGGIISTLRAASTDEEVARQLRAGRLVREVSSSGFPDATGLTLVAAPERPAARAKPKATIKPDRKPAEPETTRADESTALALEAAKEREREAKRRADLAATQAAEREAAAADRDAQRARMRIDRLQRELEAAQAELDAAVDRSRKARPRHEAGPTA